ncbi:hypothetical protein, partial [Aeromonas media]|uniref:hypothetical protein n=1 Tax=Aeromonas media TaxID=651 RepID=UPI001955178F
MDRTTTTVSCLPSPESACTQMGFSGFQVIRHFSSGGCPNQGESVNILLNFTQFFETRIEYRFQI